MLIYKTKQKKKKTKGRKMRIQSDGLSNWSSSCCSRLTGAFSMRITKGVWVCSSFSSSSSAKTTGIPISKEKA